MKAEDRVRLVSGEFDRADWAALWDRLPERLRQSAAAFVLHQLHAFESNGRWNLTWHYESNEEREESGSPIFEFDQPGDVITFTGSLQIGNVGKDATSDPNLLVTVAGLNVRDWHALKHACPGDESLGDSFREYTQHEDQRFADEVRAGLNPCRVNVPAAEFLEWCSSRSQTPDAASREQFAAEKFRNEQQRC